MVSGPTALTARTTLADVFTQQSETFWNYHFAISGTASANRSALPVQLRRRKPRVPSHQEGAMAACRRACVRLTVPPIRLGAASSAGGGPEACCAVARLASTWTHRHA